MGGEPKRRSWAVAVFVALPVIASLAFGPAAAGDGEQRKRKPKRPDLVVTSVTGIPESAEPGERLSSTVKVRNKGKRTAKPTKLKLRLSPRAKPAGPVLASRALGRLRPGKSATLRLRGAIPDDASGRYTAWACADAVAGERGKATRNNCRSAPAPIEVDAGTDPDPTFPERYVGTVTATHEFTRTSTGKTEFDGDSVREQTEMIEAEVVLTRIGAEGGYSYVSSGELDWEFIQTESTDAPTHTSECMGEGEGTLPISTTGDEYRTYVNLTPGPSGLGAGERYTARSAVPLRGEKPQYPTSCVVVESDGRTTESFGEEVYALSNWLPEPGEPDEGGPYTKQRCDPFAGGSDGRHSVRSDGALAVTISCNEVDTYEVTHAYIRWDLRAEWEWDLRPAPGD